MNKFITKIEELGYELNLDSGYPQIIMNEQKFKIYCREQTKRIINTKKLGKQEPIIIINCLKIRAQSTLLCWHFDF